MAGVNGIADVLTIVLIAFFALVQRRSSHHTMAFLCCEENDGVQFFVHILESCIHYHVLFRMAQSSAWISSFHQFSGAGSAKNGWNSVPKEGQRRWRRMQADKKREKQAAARLIQTPNSIETAEE